jgi:hypothetical protein
MRPNGKTVLVLYLEVKRPDPEATHGSERGWTYRYVELSGPAIHGAVMPGEKVQVIGESHGKRIEAQRLVSETTGATVWPGRFHLDFYLQPRLGDEPTVKGKVIEVVGPRPDGDGHVLDLFVQCMDGDKPVTKLVEMRALKVMGFVMRKEDVAVYGSWDRGLLRARRIHKVGGDSQQPGDVVPVGYTSAKLLGILLFAVTAVIVYELVQHAT